MQTYLSFFTNKMPFFGKKNSEITTKTKFKTEMQQLNAPCIYCGKEIDYFANGIEEKAYSVEHIIPESCKTRNRNDVKNFAAAHRLCNNERAITKLEKVVQNPEILKHIQEYIEFFRGKMVCGLANYSDIIKKLYAI